MRPQIPTPMVKCQLLWLIPVWTWSLTSGNLTKRLLLKNRSYRNVNLGNLDEIGRHFLTVDQGVVSEKLLLQVFRLGFEALFIWSFQQWHHVATQNEVEKVGQHVEHEQHVGPPDATPREELVLLLKIIIFVALILVFWVGRHWWLRKGLIFEGHPTLSRHWHHSDDEALSIVPSLCHSEKHIGCYRRAGSRWWWCDMIRFSWQLAKACTRWKILINNMVHYETIMSHFAGWPDLAI